MANESDEIVVAGDGKIYVAPVGTTLPTTATTALNASFVDLGYATEDGVSFSVGQDTEEIAAWQSRQAVRRLLTAVEFTAGFELMQWNENTLITAFGGGEVTSVGAGQHRFDFLDDEDALAEHIALIDFIDGTKVYRLVMPRVTLNDATEVNLNRTSAGTLPVSLKALKPDNARTAYLLTNDPAFAVGS